MEFPDDAIFVCDYVNVDALPELVPDSCSRVWAQMAREADEREAREELKAMPTMATCQVEPVLEEHVKVVGHACLDDSVGQGMPTPVGHGNDVDDDCSDITPTELEESGSEDGDHHECPDVALPTCAPASVDVALVSKNNMDTAVP